MLNPPTPAAPSRALLPALVRLLPPVAALLLAGGCSVEWQNRQAAEEVAQRARPPGSVYTGWRVFQERCARCHGSAATGSAGAPDLLPRLREMGPRRFVGVVLERYDWNLPRPATSPAAKEAQIDTVLARREEAMTMPAWQGEPQVSAHIADLYAWLSARAEGTQGPGRPAP